jgi:hypothetical protein
MRVQRIADVTHACRTSNSGRYGTEFLTAYQDFAQLFATLHSLFSKGSSKQRDSRSVSLNFVVLQQEIVDP